MRGLGVLAAVALALLMASPAAAAADTRSWQARYSVGTATVTAISSSTGRAKLTLVGVPASKPLVASIRRGTCAALGSAIVNLPAKTTTSTGRLTKSYPLSAAVMRKMRAAPALVVTLKAGTWTRCATLRALTPPPLVCPGQAPGQSAWSPDERLPTVPELASSVFVDRSPTVSGGIVGSAHA